MWILSSGQIMSAVALLEKIQLRLTTTLIRQWQEITVGVEPMFELEKPSTQLPSVLP